MKGHILELYEKVEAPHSFQDETGAIFDCIPVEQQPALRGVKASHTESTRSSAARRGRFATIGVGPRQQGRSGGCGDGLAASAGSQGPARQRHALSRGHDPDATGHARGHDPIPDAAGRTWKRDRGAPAAPLATLSRRRFADAPLGSRLPERDNGGGHSFLEHLAAGDRSKSDLLALTTLVCGWWRCEPADPRVWMAGLSRASTETRNRTCSPTGRLTITRSTGCYNMTLRGIRPDLAVVRARPWWSARSVSRTARSIGSSWPIGTPADDGGSTTTARREATPSATTPDSLYKGGALAGHATEIDYGGETVGTTSFPAMGSGAFANQGWQHAAYQRNIGYWPPQGGAMIDANLNPSQGWPGCYTAEVDLYAPPWSETLWYGGPGGNC